MEGIFSTYYPHESRGLWVTVVVEKCRSTHSLLTMQNLDLSLIIDISWYLFLSIPCRRGYVQKKIYLGRSSSGHTLSNRVYPEKDIPRYIFFWALPRERSGKDLPRYIFSRPHPVRQGVVCNLWYSFSYYIASP